MDIHIHTYGRADLRRQHTLRALHEAGIHSTLVVQQREKDLYDWEGPHTLYELPSKIQTRTPTWDHSIHDMNGSDHVVVLDDDLNFAVRRADDPTRFRQIQPGDLQEMFRAIDNQLLGFPMVGIGSREGGNRVTEPFVFNTRIMRVLGFRRSYFKEHGIVGSPLVVMADFHMNLQVLRSGADTCICNNWVNNQAEGSDAPGGCNTYRTHKTLEEGAYALAARHNGFVKVRRKETKGAWGGGTRVDVTVQWKKARGSA